MNTESTGLLTACRAAEASFHVFFTGEAPAPGTFADRLKAALSTMAHDLDGSASANLYEPPDGASDPVDALDLLAASCAGFPFSRPLDKMLFERLAALSPRGQHWGQRTGNTAVSAQSGVGGKPRILQRRASRKRMDHFAAPDAVSGEICRRLRFR